MSRNSTHGVFSFPTNRQTEKNKRQWQQNPRHKWLIIFIYLRTSDAVTRCLIVFVARSRSWIRWWSLEVRTALHVLFFSTATSLRCASPLTRKLSSAWKPSTTCVRVTRPHHSNSYRCGLLLPTAYCSVVGRSVCLLVTLWALQKRLNRSRCRLGG